MSIKIPHEPTYWFCPTCHKWDSPKVDALIAIPEHRPYRGVDVGTCDGVMLPLYSKEDIEKANNVKENGLH